MARCGLRVVLDLTGPSALIWVPGATTPIKAPTGPFGRGDPIGSFASHARADDIAREAGLPLFIQGLPEPPLREPDYYMNRRKKARAGGKALEDYDDYSDDD